MVTGEADRHKLSSLLKPKPEHKQPSEVMFPWQAKHGKLPLSGSEPTFTLWPWNTKRGVRGSNCYDYSLDDYRDKRAVKTTPGDKGWDEFRRRLMQKRATYSKCSDVVPGILADNPGAIYREAAWNPCKPGYFKMQSYVGDPKNNKERYGDFHFYRQNKDLEYVVSSAIANTPAKIAEFFGVTLSKVLKASGAQNKDQVLPEGQTVILKNANIWSHKAGWATGALLQDSCGKAIHDPRKACRDHAVEYTSYCGSFCVKVGATTTKGNTDERHRPRDQNNIPAVEQHNSNKKITGNNLPFIPKSIDMSAVAARAKTTTSMRTSRNQQEKPYKHDQLSVH